MPRGTQYEEQEQSYAGRSSGSGYGKLITIAIVLAIVGILALTMLKWETVKGNQVGIKETMSGIQTNILFPRTYFLWRGFEDIIPYDASSQVYELTNYKVQSVEGQDLIIDLAIRYRIDTAKLYTIHTTLRENFNKKVIEPAVQRIVKDEGTKLRAIDAYSGTNLVALQNAIEGDLTRPESDLRTRGFIVEAFVIRHIELDSNYVAEIKKKQTATQQQLRAVEEEKAATAEALVAKAKAQADLNKAVVEAERDAKVQVLKAQADNERVILAAKAEQEQAVLKAKGEQQRFTLEAEGKMQAAISEAKGIEALGKAKADAQRQLLESYKVEGADAYVTIEVSKNVSDGMKNIAGYLPSTMSVNVISDDILKSVQGFLKKPVTTTALK
jgi:regulator of protease activity HflC (stomatin/prohibitin superfamily)